MTELRLEDIGDYNSLKGEKKRVVWAVIIAGLLLGVIYLIAYKTYTNTEDSITIKDTISVVPPIKSIPVR